MSLPSGIQTSNVSTDSSNTATTSATTGTTSNATFGNLTSVGPLTNNGQQTSTPTTNIVVVNSSQTASTVAKASTTTTSSAQRSTTPATAGEAPQFLSKTRLQDLVREVDPTEQLDEEVEEMLLQLADDFVETTVNAACLLAKHRHANTIEVKDVQLHLETNWNMWIPGFGTDEVRPYKRATVTDAHKQRLALIRKSIKKY